MPQCVKFPSQEGKPTTLPGNFETYLSADGRNAWMEYIRDKVEWGSWRLAEQKLYAIQLRQNGTNTDLASAFLARERPFRRAEEDMFDLAKAWVAAGPIE